MVTLTYDKNSELIDNIVYLVKNKENSKSYNYLDKITKSKIESILDKNRILKVSNYGKLYIPRGNWSFSNSFIYFK